MTQLRLKTPSAILFDWDGTLVDSFQFLEGAHNAVKAQLGHKRFHPGDFAPYFGKQRDFIYQSIYGEEKQEAKKLFDQYVAQNHIAGLYPMDGAEELLETIYHLGIPCGIVSNKKKLYIEAEIEHYCWTPYIQTIIGAGDTDEDKPSSKPLEQALKNLDVTLDQTVWYVGDTSIDMEAGHKCGAQTVFLRPNSGSVEINNQYRPLAEVKDCKEIQGFLLQLFKK